MNVHLIKRAFEVCIKIVQYCNYTSHNSKVQISRIEYNDNLIVYRIYNKGKSICSIWISANKKEIDYKGVIQLDITDDYVNFYCSKNEVIKVNGIYVDKKSPEERFQMSLINPFYDELLYLKELNEYKIDIYLKQQLLNSEVLDAIDELLVSNF